MDWFRQHARFVAVWSKRPVAEIEARFRRHVPRCRNPHPCRTEGTPATDYLELTCLTGAVMYDALSAHSETDLPIVARPE